LDVACSRCLDPAISITVPSPWFNVERPLIWGGESGDTERGERLMGKREAIAALLLRVLELPRALR
jgi:hypothetical protein